MKNKKPNYILIYLFVGLVAITCLISLLNFLFTK